MAEENKEVKTTTEATIPEAPSEKPKDAAAPAPKPVPEAPSPVEKKVPEATPAEAVPEVKPEAPKAEEKKPETPKAEEKKPEAPKAEVKPEAPKAEEKKPEAPKAEEKKPEAPKAEEKKAATKKKAPAKPKAEEKPKAKKKAAKKDSTATPLVPLLFGKYDYSEVVVEDPSFQRYVNLSPVMVPHSGGRYGRKAFGKMKINIVERLINNMMRTEHATGAKMGTYKRVEKAFDIIYEKTKKNPIQVYIDALQNSAPKEEITRLRFGGISIPKAVDTSASRRLDIALRNLCTGVVKASYKNKKRLELCLASELMQAAKGEMDSFAVSKKEETERIAGSAR